MAPDSNGYLDPARSLVAGRGFMARVTPSAFVVADPAYPPREEPISLRTPGYPVFLALIFSLGGSISTVLLIQRLLNIALAVVLYLFGKATTKSPVIGAIAAIAYSAFLPAIWIADTIMSETLFTVLFFLAIVAAHAAIRRSSIPFATLAAFLLGCSTLTRPIAAWFFIPVAVMMFAFSSRRRIAVTATFVVVAQLLPAAWIVRNKRVTGVAQLSSVPGELLLMQWAAAVKVTEHAGDFFRLTASQQQFGLRAELHREQRRQFRRAMELARSNGVDPQAMNAMQKSIWFGKAARPILIQHPIAVAELWTSSLIELEFIGPTWIAAQYGFDERKAVIEFAPLSIALLLLLVYGLRQLWLRDRALAWLIGSAVAYCTLLAATPEVVMRFTAVCAPEYALAFAAGVVAFVPRAIAYVKERARRRAISGPA